LSKVNCGSVKTVHQPERRMSISGRNEVISRPRVGTVQRTAMMIAIVDAAGELSFVFAATARRSARLSRRSPGGTGAMTGVVVVIGSPRSGAAGGRCRR
jgi:hypothetical protein